MSEKTFTFKDVDSNWANVVLEMFSGWKDYPTDPEKQKEFHEEQMRRMIELTFDRPITLEESNFYQQRILSLSTLEKLIDFLDWDIPYDKRDFLPEVLKTMILTKDFIKPLFEGMRDKIINELKEKNLWIERESKDGTE